MLLHIVKPPYTYCHIYLNTNSYHLEDNFDYEIFVSIFVMVLRIYVANLTQFHQYYRCDGDLYDLGLGAISYCIIKCYRSWKEGFLKAGLAL